MRGGDQGDVGYSPTFGA